MQTAFGYSFRSAQPYDIILDNYHIYGLKQEGCKRLTESSVQLDAGRGWKQPVPVLPAAQARPLQEAHRPVVVERILAVGIRTVDRDTFEAFDAGT